MAKKRRDNGGRAIQECGVMGGGVASAVVVGVVRR
jgi:hypothetical protein